jgi:hypothetical protein
MTHTKEPWVLRLNAGDETRIQADNGAGISLAVCDIKCGGMSGRTVAEGERMAADLVARYNALAGLNPAALAGLIEAVEDVSKEIGDKVGTDGWCEDPLHGSTLAKINTALANIRGEA